MEARVGLLESQNQQLIEELQKFKAICFKELCGLELNKCNATVLTTVTTNSVNSTTSTYCTVSPPSNSVSRSDCCSSIESVNFSTNLIVTTAITTNITTHQNDRVLAHSMVSDYSDTTESVQTICYPPRTRHRRQSVFSSSKLSPYAAQTAWVSPYQTKYDYEKPSSINSCTDNDLIKTSSVTCYLDSLNYSNSLMSSSNMESLVSTTTITTTTNNNNNNNNDGDNVLKVGCVSEVNPSVYHLSSPSHCTSPVIAPYLSSGLTRTSLLVNNDYTMNCSSNDVGVSNNSSMASNNSSLYQHPRYAAKRAYRNIYNNLNETDEFNGIEDKRFLSKSTVTSSINMVTEAAVILAAAAAMVVESKSSTDPDGDDLLDSRFST